MNQTTPQAALLATLTANRKMTVSSRQLPEENVAALKTSGLCRVYNPPRFGGPARHMAEVIPGVAQIAQACPNSAWVLAVYQIHTWLVALMADESQRAVFADDPDPLICAALNPSKNRGKRTADGIRVESGRFSFCSGAPGADWALLGMLLEEHGEVVDAGCLLAPKQALTPMDDWYVAGLQGTGSHSLLAKDLVLPESYFLSYNRARAGDAPGLDCNPEPLYRAAFVPMLVLNLAAPALGTAQYALQAFLDNLENRGEAAGSHPLPAVTRIDSAAVHTAIAEATLAIDTARLMLRDAADTLCQRAENDQPLTALEAAKINLQTSHAVRRCQEAVQRLLLHAGGAVLQPDHPLQQAWQDVVAMNCHGFLDHEANLPLYGSLATGHAHPEAFL